MARERRVVPIANKEAADGGGGTDDDEEEEEEEEETEGSGGGGGGKGRGKKKVLLKGLDQSHIFTAHFYKKLTDKSKKKLWGRGGGGGGGGGGRKGWKEKTQRAAVQESDGEDNDSDDWMAVQKSDGEDDDSDDDTATEESDGEIEDKDDHDNSRNRFGTKKRAAGSGGGCGVDPEAAAHAAVARWTNGVDIFTKKFVLVPIVERLHWSMAIICNLDCFREYLRREQAAATVAAEAGAGGEVDDGGCTAETKKCPEEGGAKESRRGSKRKWANKGKQPKRQIGKKKTLQPLRVPCVLFMDSFGMHSAPKVAANLRAWLKYEWRAKKAKALSSSTPSASLSSPSSPVGAALKKRSKVGGVVAAAAGGGGQEDTGSSSSSSSSNSGSDMPGGDFLVDDALVDEFFGGSRGGVSTCIGGQQVGQPLALLCPEVPKQDNGFDCGVFALQYGEEVVQRSPDISSEDLRRNVVSGFNRHMFSTDDMHAKRRDLKHLIEALCLSNGEGF